MGLEEEIVSDFLRRTYGLTPNAGTLEFLTKAGLSKQHFNQASLEEFDTLHEELRGKGWMDAKLALMFVLGYRYPELRSLEEYGRLSEWSFTLGMMEYHLGVNAKKRKHRRNGLDVHFPIFSMLTTIVMMMKSS